MYVVIRIPRIRCRLRRPGEKRYALGLGKGRPSYLEQKKRRLDRVSLGRTNVSITPRDKYLRETRHASREPSRETRKSEGNVAVPRGGSRCTLGVLSMVVPGDRKIGWVLDARSTVSAIHRPREETRTRVALRLIRGSRLDGQRKAHVATILTRS